MTHTPLQLSPAPSGLARQPFVDAYGGIYESSAWIAERVWDDGLDRTHDTVDGLHRAMESVVGAAGEARQLALLNAHPDLAGRAAVAGELTTSSTEEQASAGLDHCTPDEFARFTRLNADYRSQFDFPFIMAVRGATRADILAAFDARLNNSAAAEFNEALRQVGRIARLRLEQMAA